MRATTIAFAGTLMLAATFLASCNDDAAPVAKDTSQANPLTPDPAAAGGALVAEALPAGGVAPAAASQAVPQPNARLLRPTNLAPRTATRTVGAGVSARIDVFFDELGRYGSWVRHPDFSYVWLPGRQGRGWRPYQEGRWLWTDEHGWYWESSEPFAWAVYHYGRWDYDPDLGWFWVPGDTWAPAWVTWHHGGGRTGWAPIAPDRKGYAIGVPKHFVPPVSESWVFVEDRNFADPTLGQYVLPIRQIGAMLGVPSDVDGTRGFRREEIERFGGRRIEKREVVYVGSDGDAFEDVRGGRIGIYRPMIEEGEIRQPPHVVITDVTRVDRVVIREYTETRVAGAPSVALLTVLDKGERQRLESDRLNQQAAAVDSQIARLQQERATAIEERRREAEQLQAQIEQERQAGALQRKQEQQQLLEARRQRAETITVDRTPSAATPPAATATPPPAQPATAPRAPQGQQVPAPGAPPPAGASAPAAPNASQTPTVATAPAALPARVPPTSSPAAVPAQRSPSPETKTAPGAAAIQPVPPAGTASAPTTAPAQPVTPEAKTAPWAPTAKPVPPAGTASAPIAPPVQRVPPPEAKIAPVAPTAQPVPPAGTASAPTAPPAQRVPPPEAKTAPTAQPVPPAGTASAPLAPPVQRVPPPEAKIAPVTPSAQPVPPAGATSTPTTPPAQRVPPEAKAAPQQVPPAAVPIPKDAKSAGKPNPPAATGAPGTAGNPEPARP